MTVQRTGASRHAEWRCGRRRRLAPVADLGVGRNSDSMAAPKLQLLPAYHPVLRRALWCQVIGVTLASMVLDSGHFCFRYLIITFVFWIIVGAIAFIRPTPTSAERIAIGFGPQIILWTMWIAPWG